VALIAGTGVPGPEIEDGTMVYLLSKPIARFRVIVTVVSAADPVLPLLAAATLGAVWLASDRLRSLSATSAD
jgi:ABC-2 type transport system permease protein